MNAIEIKNRIDLYMDTTRNGRFGFIEYNQAVRDAIRKFVDDMYGDIQEKNPYSLQSSQQIRDNLFTLLTNTSITPSALPNILTNYGSVSVNQITNPTDYYELVSMRSLINGISTYINPTTYNQLGPLLEDSFKQPSNTQPYFLDDGTGYQIYISLGGVLTSVNFEYLRKPALFSIGYENLLLNPGIVLTIGFDYIAVQQSVNNTVTYQPGQLFTAGATNLISGQVILASNTTTCDLPEKVHEQIAKMAAEIMSGNVADYNRAQFVNKEAKES